MTSNSWADVMLVVVLLAPLAAVVLAYVLAASNDDERWTTGGCAVAAGGALVLLIAGQHPRVGRLAPDDLALAAAGATALLAMGVRASARGPIVAVAVSVATCGIATGAAGRPSTVGPMLAIAAAVTLLAMARDATRLVTALVGAGVVVAAAGVRSGGRGGTTAVIAGVAIVATLASLASRRSLIVVVPAALVLGVRLGPALAATPTSRWLAVALGVAAGALVIVPAVVRRLSGRGFGAVLVPWTLLAAVGPVVGTTAAARPLAVGAVLAVALGGELSLLAAVPGAAVLVYALADGHGWSRAALSVLVAVTALGLTFDRLRPDGLDAVSASDRAARLGVIDGAVLALASWFVIRPTSWAWTRVGDLDAYSDGTAIALASALIAGVLLTISGGRLERTPLTPWFGAASDDDVASSTKVDALTVGIVALTGLIAAALVRSARL